jgi:DNA-binding NtrC family response regulator
MNVLVVDDEPGVRKHLGRAIERVWRDARVACVGSLPEAERALEREPPDVATVDLQILPDRTQLLGVRLLERMARVGRVGRAIAMTGQGDEAVTLARRAGAPIVLTKPFGDGELRDAGRQLGIEVIGGQEPIEPALALLVGASRAMQDLREAVRRAAGGDLPVLVQGETGTGKELVARAIHGLRAKGPFHALNCSTLEALTESQLFGHARGAFTSAERATRGAIERAEDGVLFLDEIGDLARTLQPRLLRALEGHAFQALGDERKIELRARVVAASHVDLEAAVAEGTFREDLYWRLAVHVIPVPPLRERAEDLPALVRTLLARRRWSKAITEEAVALLAMQAWPGNVRQLIGALEGLTVRCDGDVIEARDVRAAAEDRDRGSLVAMAMGPVKATSGVPGEGVGRFDAEIGAHERRLIEKAVRDAGGNKVAAAKALGIDRMRMMRLLRKLGGG